MTIAQELENQLFIIADPKMKWVRHSPSCGETCLVASANFARYPQRFFLSLTTREWLNDFVCRYASLLLVSAAYFNDVIAKNRQEVIWMLEEAVDQAKAEGV